MPRPRRRKRPDPKRIDPAPLRSAALTRRESGPDGEWIVRSVPGSSSVKEYRCPGCDQSVSAGTGHLVTWPAEEWGSVADRRHWHATCWEARARRRPGGRR